MKDKLIDGVVFGLHRSFFRTHISNGKMFLYLFDGGCDIINLYFKGENDGIRSLLKNK